MPQVRLDANDAGELAEMLESLSHWLGSDPALQTSFGRWIGHPGYGITQLRQDLDRFTFLLGGHDGEHWLTDAQPGNRLTSPGHGARGDARLDTGPSREATSGPKGAEPITDPARRRSRLRPPAPCQAGLSLGATGKS